MSPHEFPPAAALLIEAGRHVLGTGGTLDAQALRDADWEAVPDLAARHGMSAWVHALLLDASGAAAPAHVRDLVAERSRTQRVRALAAVSQLAALAGDLARAGVDVVALKGPLFSRWLYGDAGLRRFADLDLLVAPEQRDRALHVLNAAGYSLPGGLSASAARTVYAGTGAWPLSHETAVSVDLHWRVQAFGFGAPLRAGEVLADSITTRIGGSDVRLPSATHAATLTLVHAAKHVWSSFEIPFSIAHLVRRHDVDWTNVYHSTRRAGAWNGSAAGLALAAALFGVELPAVFREPIARVDVRPLLNIARERLDMADVAGATLGAELRAHCASLDSARSRFRYAAWRLLAPTPLEAAWCRLPDTLAPLYAPMRLIRLAVSPRNR